MLEAPVTPFPYSRKSRLSKYRLADILLPEEMAIAAGVAMNGCEDLPRQWVKLARNSNLMEGTSVHPATRLLQRHLNLLRTALA